MVKIYIRGGQASISVNEKLTTNAINAYELGLSYAEDWVGFTKTAVFYQTTKSKKYSVEYATTNVYYIPNELLRVDLPVYVGFYGYKDGVKKTTNYVKLEIAEGADGGADVGDFVRTVDKKIKYIRLNEKNIFEYSTDGSTWKELKGGSGGGSGSVNDVLINGEAVAKIDDEPNIVTDTADIVYEDINGTKKLRIASGVKEAITKNTSDVAQAKSDITQAKTDIKANTDDIANNTSDITTIKADITKIKEDVAQNDTNIGKAFTELSKQDTSISENKSAILQNTYDIDDLNTAINTTNKALTETNKELGELQTAIGETNSALEEVENTVGNHTNEINGLKTSKLDKAGGTISGNLAVQGDLTVSGTTKTENVEQLAVAEAMIIVNSAKVDLQIVLSGLAINKNAQATYGLVYDPATDTVKFGEGTVDENKKFTFKAGEGYPIGLRADSTQFTDAHLLKWNATKNIFEDCGYTVQGIVNMAKNDSNAYTNEEITKAKKVCNDYTDTETGKAKTACNEYTDSKANSVKNDCTTYTDNSVVIAKTECKNYTDEKVTASKTKIVNITLRDGATQGTLTTEEYNALVADDRNILSINNNELFYLTDKGHTTGINTYTHDGFNEKGVTKYLNLTIATKAFTITTENNGIDIKQETGTSTTAVMSQDATTKAINAAKSAAETASNSYTDTKVSSALGSIETLLADIDTGSGV